MYAIRSYYGNRVVGNAPDHATEHVRADGRVIDIHAAYGPNLAPGQGFCAGTRREKIRSGKRITQLV